MVPALGAGTGFLIGDRGNDAISVVSVVVVQIAVVAIEISKVVAISRGRRAERVARTSIPRLQPSPQPHSNAESKLIAP